MHNNNNHAPDTELNSVACPACNTRFRCQLSDLTPAQGLLRCGLCQHVFSALDQLTPPQLQAYQALLSDSRTETGDGGAENGDSNTSDSDDNPLPLAEKPDNSAAWLEGLSTADQGIARQPPPPRRRRWHWFALNLATLLALILQLAFWYRGPLLKAPQLPPEISQQLLSLCARLDLPCLPATTALAPRASRNIVSQKLLVRPHPSAANALQVDAILFNRGDHDLPFPLLRLRFSNIHGTELASRVFHPSEYLAGELNPLSRLASRQPVHIALEIAAPDPAAVNYELKLFSQP